MISSNANIKVSVCCTSYNHEKFINDSIKGFLLQKTDFPIEIIIHDDASTDNTSNIIKDYESNYPNLIKAIYQKENQYSKGKKIFSTFMLPQANGKYIALCEGDDYWSDPLKLQKQIDFLENNPDFSICFHKVGTLKDNKIEEDTHKNYYKEILLDKEIFYIDDLLKDNFIATCSVVFRKNFSIFPEWYGLLQFGDWALHILNTSFGKIKYIDEAMAVYRIHEKGLWSNKSISLREEAILKFYKIINKHLKFQYTDLIFESVSNQCLKYVNYSSGLLEAKKWLETQLSQTQTQLSQTQTQLSQTQTQLAQVLNSRGYRIVNKLRNIINFYFPRQSNRRKFAERVFLLFSICYKKFNRSLRSFNKGVNKIKNAAKIVKIENKKWPDNAPLVSIIIPCFNYGRFIEESIDSVLAQTFQNFEIIVVDGGSNDSFTAEFLNNLNKPKTSVMFRNNRHFVGDNRNYGIALAKGKYICCLDADDLLDPTYLEKALFFLETYKYDVSYPGVQCFGDKSIVWEAEKVSFEDMINRGNSVSTVAVFRKEAWEKCGGYKDFGINKDHIPEDWEFWVRLIGNGYRFKNIREPLMLYRIHNNSLTATCETTTEGQRIIIYNENKNLLAEKFIKLRKTNNSIIYNVINPTINLQLTKAKKRILFAFPFLIIGGAEISFLRIIESLLCDFDITIITTVKPNPECGSMLNQFRKFTKEIYNLQDFLDNKDEMKCFIMYLIESRKIDLIFIAGCELIYHLLPEIKKKYKNIKIIDELFNEIGHIENNRKYSKIIDLNIAANENIKTILTKKFNEKIEKIKVIIHGVDVANTYNPDKIFNKDDTPIAIANDKLVISYFGRFSSEKGPDLFVKIIKELKDHNIHAMMAGNGPEYPNIINFIESNKINGKIFTPGFINDIKPLLLKTDILIVPSRIDGLPMIILEALSLGVTVIASKVGGIPSIIIDGYNGFLCESENISSFISKIEILYNDKNLLSQMKKNAREYALSNISEERMNSSYKNAIENLINS